MNKNGKLILLSAMAAIASAAPVTPVMASQIIVDGGSNSDDSDTGIIIIGGEEQGGSSSGGSSETQSTGTIRVSLYNQTNDKAETGSSIRIIDGNNGNMLYFIKDGSGYYTYSTAGAHSNLEPSPSGEIVIKGLNGSYRIEEASTRDGVSCSTRAQNISVSGGETRSATFTYKTELGEAVVTLTSEDMRPIQGGYFSVKDSNGRTCYFISSGSNYRYDSDGNISELPTSSAGKIGIKDMPPGNYQLKQVSAPSQYNGDLVTKDFDVQKSRTTSINVTNRELYGNFSVNLRDQDDKAVSGGVYRILNEDKGPITVKKVDDGEYEFSRDSDLVDMESKDGVLSVKNIPQGKYSIKEEKVPARYKASGERQFAIQASQAASMNVKYEKAVGNIRITLKDEMTGDPIPGFSFQLINKETEDVIHFTEKEGTLSVAGTGNTDMKTNEEGVVVLTKIPAGDYYVKQSVAAPGYLINPNLSEVSIETDQEASFDVTSSKSNSALSFVDSMQNPVAGVKFDIKDENGKVVLSGESNENGRFLVSGIPAGNYSLSVTGVPETFSLYHQNINFKMDETGMSDGLDAVTLEYTTITINAGVAGSVFELRDSNGRVVDIQTSGADGIVKFEKLNYGDYTIHNTSAPEGYKVYDNVIKISIDDKFYNGDVISASSIEDGASSPGTVSDDKNSSKGMFVFMLLLGISAAGGLVFLIVRLVKEMKHNDDTEEEDELVMVDEETGEPISKEDMKRLEREGVTFKMVGEEQDPDEEPDDMDNPEDPELANIQKGLENQTDRMS